MVASNRDFATPNKNFLLRSNLWAGAGRASSGEWRRLKEEADISLGSLLARSRQT